MSVPSVAVDRVGRSGPVRAAVGEPRGERPPAAGPDLAEIIRAYHEVTERLRVSHEQLQAQVARLREEIADKNRELARRERLAALGSMAAGLAHEIRNPLAGIQLYASLLERDLSDRPAARRLAERISRGVQSLERLVTDILAFAGPESLHVSEIALGRVLREAREHLQGVLVQRGVEWTWPAEAERVRLCADAAQLRLALVNLVRNAAEVSPAGGRVELAARVSEEGGRRWCHLAVRDRGPGIDPALLERIFNPFFTTREDGTGLGLAIVHRVAEAHGGCVRARNRRGGGAEFVVSIPVDGVGGESS